LRINKTEELGDKLIRKKYCIFLTIQKQLSGVFTTWLLRNQVFWVFCRVIG